MEDEKVVVDDQTVNEDKTEENEVSDDKDLKSALAQKEHFREKTEKLEAEKAELLAQVEKANVEVKPTQTQTETATPDVDALNNRLARIEFSQAHPEIDSGDIEQIFDLAGLNKITPEKILQENDMVKTHLEKKATEKKVVDATPDVNRSGGVPHDKPISEMSREEHRDWAAKVMGQS